jgi:hypothetical protein
VAVKLFTLAAVNIPTAGTRVQITATETYTTTVMLQAAVANVGNIFIGDSSVSSTRGLALSPGQVLTLTADLINRGQESLNIADLYVDTATNSNNLWVSYFAPR